MRVRCLCPSLAADHLEWEAAWTALASHRLNQGDRCCQDLNALEVWQYMGTEAEPDGSAWFHCFRHRCHPRTQKREYIRIPSTTEWQAQELRASGS